MNIVPLTPLMKVVLEITVKHILVIGNLVDVYKWQNVVMCLINAIVEMYILRKGNSYRINLDVKLLLIIRHLVFRNQ